MKESNLYLGLDVHRDDIVALVVNEEGEERDLGAVPNTASSIKRLVKKLGKKERIRAV